MIWGKVSISRRERVSLLSWHRFRGCSLRDRCVMLEYENLLKGPNLMKALLLAAGRGTRISKHIDDVPKCTLPVGDVPLIRRTAQQMLELGIEPVVCLGYRPDVVEKSLEGLPVKFYYNPFYDVTNSIASLWFARKELDEDLIVMNADVFLSTDLLLAALNDPREILMLSDASRTEEGDYFFTLGGSAEVVRYGKDLPPADRSAEYVGMARLAASFVPTFETRMNELIHAQKHNCWWEEILYSFVDTGEVPISTMDVDGYFWSEIDYLDDYERILRHVELAASQGKRA